MTPKFIQIVCTSNYTGGNFGHHQSLWGLTADGEVYQWFEMSKKWEKLETK